MDCSDIKHLVRAADPITSIVAAEQATKFIKGHKAAILSALEHQRCTAKEISRDTGLTVVQVDRRLPDLKALGYVEVAQEGGEDMVRGNYRVWQATEKAAPFFAQKNN